MTPREPQPGSWEPFLILIIVAMAVGVWAQSCNAQDTIPYKAYPYLGLGHSTPPVCNVVGAGLNLEGAAKDRRTGLWIALAGGALAAGMASNEDMADSPGPLVIGALTAVFSLSFTLSGLKWEDRAGDLLQCGYSPQYLYESVPDSVGSDPPKRFTLPAMIDNTPIRIPARFK